MRRGRKKAPRRRDRTDTPHTPTGSADSLQDRLCTRVMCTRAELLETRPGAASPNKKEMGFLIRSSAAVPPRALRSDRGVAARWREGERAPAQGGARGAELGDPAAGP
eukprot:2651137-Pyramimonas_sp.AAC.1